MVGETSPRSWRIAWHYIPKDTIMPAALFATRYPSRKQRLPCRCLYRVEPRPACGCRLTQVSKTYSSTSRIEPRLETGASAEVTRLGQQGETHLAMWLARSLASALRRPG
jgi:hypothetical protein